MEHNFNIIFYDSEIMKQRKENMILGRPPLQTSNIGLPIRVIMNKKCFLFGLKESLYYINVHCNEVTIISNKTERFHMFVITLFGGITVLCCFLINEDFWLFSHVIWWLKNENNFGEFVNDSGDKAIQFGDY